MTTSGTAAFDLDLTEIIEEAGERCGYEIRTGYDFRTARRSLNLLFADWANRGINLWTLEQGSIPLVAGTSTYALPADTVDLLETVVRTGTGSTQSDIAINRISLSTYATIPTKNNTGRPIQMAVQRLNTPQVILWPVPDNSTPYTLVYWRLRRIQDAGGGINTSDMPFRFLPAMIAGLAYYLALKVPGGLERLQVLKAQYDEAWGFAADEDREKATVRIVPRMGYV
jgi:hypothetical protein